MPALRRISGELKVPEPARSRIVLEMAADVEALFQHYRGCGLEEDEAARLTEERLLASPEALEQLIRVHTTGHGRWLSRAAGGLRWGFDALLFGLAVVPLLAFAGYVVGVQLRVAGGGPVLWPVVALGVVIAGISLYKGFELFVQRERRSAKLRRGLFPLAVLGAQCVVLGLIGFLFTLHEAAGVLARSDPAEAPAIVVAAVAASGTVLILAVLTAVGAALVWFVMANRIAAIERAESAVLLAE